MKKDTMIIEFKSWNFVYFLPKKWYVDSLPYLNQSGGKLGVVVGFVEGNI